MSSSRHHQDQNSSWASLTEEQRRGYSSAVDQHLTSVQAEVDQIRAEVEVARGVIKRQQESEQAFNDVISPDSSLYIALDQWSSEWRDEESSLEPPIDQAHSEHSDHTQESEQKTRETHELNKKLTTLKKTLESLITGSSKAEQDAREAVRAHDERDSTFKVMVKDINTLSANLSRVEVDQG